jgi:hypothetical protein
VGLVPDAAIEGNDRSVVAGANMFDQRAGVDAFVDKQNEVVVAGRGCH